MKNIYIFFVNISAEVIAPDGKLEDEIILRRMVKVYDPNKISKKIESIARRIAANKGFTKKRGFEIQYSEPDNLSPSLLWKGKEVKFLKRRRKCV